MEDPLSLCGAVLHSYTLCEFGQFLSKVHSVREEALPDTVRANLRQIWGLSSGSEMLADFL